jgi:hypothetical protein
MACLTFGKSTAAAAAAPDTTLLICTRVWAPASSSLQIMAGAVTDHDCLTCVHLCVLTAGGRCVQGNGSGWGKHDCRTVQRVLPQCRVHKAGALATWAGLA